VEALLKKRIETLNKQDSVVKKYREAKSMPYAVNVIDLVKQYEKLREEILDIEDQIARIDPNVLDNIVEPNPEHIDDAIHLHTDDDWKYKIK
jgi:phosphoglucomutase